MGARLENGVITLRLERQQRVVCDASLVLLTFVIDVPDLKAPIRLNVNETDARGGTPVSSSFSLG